QQAGVPLCDMENDRTRLEQGEFTFLIGRNLSERMKRSMRGFLHLTERNQTNIVGLAHFFKRPTNAHVARKSPAAIERLFKGCNGGGHLHGRSPCLACTYDERTASDTTCFFTCFKIWASWPARPCRFAAGRRHSDPVYRCTRTAATSHDARALSTHDGCRR